MESIHFWICQKRKVCRFIPDIRNCLSHDVGGCMTIRIQDRSICTTIQPSFDADSGKLRIFIIHTIGRNIVLCRDICFGCVAFFLFNDLDPAFNALYVIIVRRKAIGMETNFWLLTLPILEFCFHNGFTPRIRVLA